MASHPNEEIHLDRTFIQDPHGLYRRLRAEGPLHRVRIWGNTRVWLVSRYAEAKVLLSDPRLSKDLPRITALFPPSGAGPMSLGLGANVLFTDPPDHTRLRRLVARAFTPHAVAGLRPFITSTADELLDAMDDSAAVGPVDVISAFAAPLPLGVIGRLLGVPARHGPQFRSLVAPLVTTTEPSALRRTQRELTELLSEVIESKRHSPASDVLTMLVQTADDGDRLSESELIAMAFLLILAGYETTVNLIGNGMVALAEHPAQFRRLQRHPELVDSAVEELLRYESPVNTATLRVTTEVVRLGELTIPADELVLISLLSAGCDESQFPAAGELDIGRHPNNHLAFGHGIHFCVGAPLARLEARITLHCLLQRFDTLQLVRFDGVTYRNSLLLRGPRALPMVLQRKGHAHKAAPD